MTFSLRRFTRRIALPALILLGAISLFAAPQQQAKQAKQTKQDPFHRPKPTRPTTPVVPTIDRAQDDKIFLEQADSLFRINPIEDIKIVKGNVIFRQQGMLLTCDSAYFYSDQDKAECFGNVKLQQGDTLFLYADRINYNGIRQFATLRNGPSMRKVRLINRTDTLITDSLDYNLRDRLGWYNEGGELHDPTITLTSGYGEYSPSTKEARFFRNVVLINRKDHYRLLSDTLYYNTRTGIASIDSRTIIESENDTIITTGGTYNTNTGFADLQRRSIIVHRDSNQNVVTLEGDSIIFDRDLEVSRAYRFRAPYKHSEPVVLTDTANHAVIMGGYGFYDNKNRMAMATEYPLLYEYSRPDTVFLRADTIRTYMLTAPEERDTLGNIVKKAEDYYLAKAYNRARIFRPDIQGIADSITYVSLDSMIYLNRKPVVWSDERQIKGEIIEIHVNDSTADWVRLPLPGIVMDHVEEDFYNQLSAKEMLATIEDGTIKRLEAEGNVMTIILPQEKDSTYNKFVNAESSFLDVTFTKDDLDKLKMWPEVTGKVTPIGKVPDSDKLLRGAVWLEAIRPLRRWYGSTVVWEDELGELPEELERYFSN